MVLNKNKGYSKASRERLNGFSKNWKYKMLTNGQNIEFEKEVKSINSIVIKKLNI